MNPRRWYPLQTTGTYGRRPEVGQILAFEFEAWRVIDVADVLPLDPRAQQYHVGLLKLIAGVESGKRHMITVTESAAPDPSTYRAGYLDANPWARKGRSPNFEVLPEHYAVCAKCGDIVPCREVFNERRATEAVQELERYDDPSICPACGEVFTLRQKTVSLPNIISPFGGEVTFHRRGKCVHSAASYEKRVQKATGRSLTLSCGGTLVQHRDLSLECLDLDCPDVNAEHGNFTQCRYRSHGCPRLECQLGG